MPIFTTASHRAVGSNVPAARYDRTGIGVIMSWLAKTSQWCLRSYGLGPIRLSARIVRRALPLLVAGTIATGMTACGHRINDGSVFDQFVSSQPPGKKPRKNQDIRTEYPTPNSWGPRVAEYRGTDNTTEVGFRGYGARTSTGGYELNFNDAELSEVVRVVLLDTLKINYSIDPAVRGKITLAAPQPLSKADVLNALETVLQMNGAALLKDGSGYKIVPSTAARTAAGAISYAAEQRQVGAGYGVSVLALKHVSSSQMMRLLTSFITQPGSLKAETNRNLLLIRGTGSERATLLNVASSFDVDWLKGQSAGIYRLLYATPDEMITELNSVLRSEQGAAGQDLIRFEPIQRLNAVLVLTQKQKLLDAAAQWIRRLDKTNPLSSSLYVYRVEHSKAAYLADLLRKMFQGNQGFDSSTNGTLAFGQPPGTITTAALPSQQPQSRPQQAPAIGAPGQRPPDASSPLDRQNVRTVISIVADETQNKLLIRAPLRDYKKIVHVLARLDRPAAQVLIKATLAEVQLNKNLRYGVQAFLQESKRAPNGVLGFSNGPSLTIQPSLPGLNFMVGLPATPKVILDALSNQTSVRLVSSPSLVVVNNETGVLQIGDDVPIATRQAVSVTDPAAPIVNNIEFRKTGVILKVTPRINSDGLVTMVVEQEISAVASASAEQQTGTLTPTISQRRIVSTISVYSGQMVVLGGLVSERTSKLANRVPILEKVPVVGELVGKTDDVGGRTELVIFIQPQVIRGASDAPRIAAELRERLGTLAPDDRRRRRVLRFKDENDRDHRGH
ncbi:MAG TPA: type II secretion system secretin GspD [Hyphomicrobiaceae bacterium]|nr:type II secretion system secretin GspD [Hyphomicrobiaceae bacterium]